MLDVILSALRHPRDYAGVLHSHPLTFREQRHESDSYYSFIFTSAHPLTWRAGQHGILFLPTSQRDRGWRPFSVASSPHENEVRIGTRIDEPHSEFKEVLRTLTPGTTVHFRGPFGSFHAGDTPTQLIGIAGGIGITPLRALAYEVANGHLPDTKLHIIYGTNDSYPYQTELDQWAAETDRLTVKYQRDPALIQDAITNQWNTFGNHARYLISGSPGMIRGVRQHCRTIGIETVVHDPFKGY